jgi:general secretion pathway protein K
MTSSAKRVRTVADERGLALIVAMLIAALAAAVAVSVATAQAQWSAQVEHRRDQVEAQSIALAGVAWARAIVAADTSPIDYLGAPWSLPLPATPVENGAVEGRIVDAQSMLNVNMLSGAHAPQARGQFTRLFAALGLPESTLDATIDWVDANDVPEPNGAEDAWYMVQADPSLAANGRAARIEELANVRGMTPAAMLRLAPFVTALPEDTAVNVNTAPSEVLAALLDGIQADALASLVADRNAHPFTTPDDFLAHVPKTIPAVDRSLLSVNTGYFLVFVRARQGETVANARALVKRDKGTSSIVWQTIE